jgi:hypothetical protein
VVLICMRRCVVMQLKDERGTLKIVSGIITNHFVVSLISRLNYRFPPILLYRHIVRSSIADGLDFGPRQPVS